MTEVGKETDSSENIPRGLSCGIVGFAWRGREEYKLLKGKFGVVKDALEMRLETEIPSNHNILAWLVAGTVVNRYEVGRDGKTPYERLRGKQSRLIGLEFGEKVNFRRTAVGCQDV